MTDASDITLNFSGAVQRADSIILNFGVTFEAPEPEPEPPQQAPWEIKVNGEFGLNWGISQQLYDEKTAKFNTSRQKDIESTFLWGDSDQKYIEIIGEYNQAISLYVSSSFSWNETKAVQNELNFPWGLSAQRHKETISKWDNGEQLYNEHKYPWGAPDSIYYELHSPWNRAQPKFQEFDLSWRLNRVPTKIAAFDFPWGIGRQLYLTKHIPPGPDPEPPAPLPFQGLKGDNITLVFWKPPYKGDGVILPFGESPIFYGEGSGMNTGSLTLLDGTPIAVDAVGVTKAIGDFGWRFRANVLKQSALDLIKPSSGILVDLRLTLNDYQWIVTIDDWQRQRRFGQNTYSVTGWPTAIRLMPPHYAPSSYKETSLKTAQQLAIDALSETGYALNWGLAYDWTVPANVFSYEQKTPLEAVAYIADAAQGIAYCDRTANTIHVKPRYPVVSWDWSTTAADETLADSYTEMEGTRYSPRHSYDSVFVTGDKTGGKTVNATIDGYPGSDPAPTWTHSLITEDTTVARMAAEGLLSWSGDKRLITRRLPLYRPTSLNPGLLEIGQLIEVGGEKGLVNSITVEAGRVQNGSTVHLSIMQTVVIEVIA